MWWPRIADTERHNKARIFGHCSPLYSALIRIYNIVRCIKSVRCEALSDVLGKAGFDVLHFRTKKILAGMVRFGTCKLVLDKTTVITPLM